MANIANVKVKQGNILSLSGSSVEITGSTTTVGGDLNVQGTISASVLTISETIISSSVVYHSGSTKFGDEAGDTHTFTGSVSINGLVSSSVGFSGSGAGLTNLTGASSQFPSFQQDVRNQLSGVGAINYNPANGQISTTALTAAVTQINPGNNIVVTSGSGPTATVALTSSITGGLDNIKVTNEVSGAVGRFTTLSASNAEFSGNVLIYGTASLSPNPSAAYIRYTGLPQDKIEIVPGLLVSGSSIISGNLDVTGSVSASSFTGNGTGLTNLPAANLSGVVSITNGGTGQSSPPTNGQLLIGSGSSFVLGTLTAGDNIVINNSSGSITISASVDVGIQSVTSSDPNLQIQNGTGPDVTASLASNLSVVSLTASAGLNTVNLLATGSFTIAQRTVTGSASILSTDQVVFANASSGSLTVTLPAVGAGSAGRQLVVKKVDAGADTVTVSGSIDGGSFFELNGPYQSITLVCDGSTNWFVL